MKIIDILFKNSLESDDALSAQETYIIRPILIFPFNNIDNNII